MRATSFGQMSELKLPTGMLGQCEVMHFEKAGRPHRHNVRDEYAICITGSGTVWIDGVRHGVFEGEFVRIPAKAHHYMEPSNGEPMTMLIAYAVRE